MNESLPFINSTGLISKILNKIVEAQTPERYTQDFQSTVLGYGSGSARAFIPLLKRIGFLNSDGSPSELYKEFRSEVTRGRAMAQALRIGYNALYKVNEYAHKLDKQKLKDAVIRVTGADKKSGTVTAIVGTFECLTEYLENNVEYADIQEGRSMPSSITPTTPIDSEDDGAPPRHVPARGMNLSYTINLNLPSSKDPEVFNAIFKSLKENLLG